MQDYIRMLSQRYPTLKPLEGMLLNAYHLLADCFGAGGRLLLCGNGGNACDCGHIAGELMKGFPLKRPLSTEGQSMLPGFGEGGMRLAQKLQRALPPLVLSGVSGLSTAFANDVDAAFVYAQQAYAYTNAQDVPPGISASGNAENVCLAAIAAKSKGAEIIGLTGKHGGRLVPVYHCPFAMPEEAFFGEASV